MKRRVVVTGLGAVTPIGNDVESFWNGVKEGKVGIGPITRFDTTGYKATLAAELKGFVAKDRMDPRTARRMEPFSQYAVAAALEAVENAGLKMEEEDPYMVGVIIGSGVGSLQATELNEKKLVEKGPSRVDPLLVPKMITNMAAGNVSIATGAKGKCTNVVTACATGTHCIGDAFRAIQYGDADVMLAGGTEGAICPIGAQARIRCVLPFLLTKTEVVLSWVKAQVWLFWKNWNMRKREMPISWQRLWDMVQLQMLFISHLRPRTEAAPHVPWKTP